MINILSKIFFKVIPGLCFLFFLGKLFMQLDGQFRPEHPWWLTFFNMAALFYIIAILYWVVLGDLKDMQPGSQKGAVRVSPYMQLSTLIFSLIYYFLLFPPTNLFTFFVTAGATYYLGIFLADWLIIARNEVRSFIAALQKKAYGETKLFVFVFIPLFFIFSAGTFFVLYELTKTPVERNFLVTSLPVWVSFLGSLFARIR